MRLVVDIDDDLYKQILPEAKTIIYSGMRSGKTLLTILLNAIGNGTPLPKGHGALKDEKDLITKVELNYRNSPKPIYVEAVKDMIRTTVSVIKPDDE